MLTVCRGHQRCIEIRLAQQGLIGVFETKVLMIRFIGRIVLAGRLSPNPRLLYYSGQYTW